MRLFWVCLLVAACGDDATSDFPVATPEHNPLGTNDEILPFPSSLYETADPTSPTGYVLSVPVGAFPKNATTGAPFDPTPLARRHGWSPVTTILWAAPGGVDPATLTGQDDMATSITLASSTLILDVTANQLVAHFAEVDVNEQDHLSNQAVYLRPAQRLTGGHRYAVAITKAVKANGGKDLARTPAFQSVLDNRDFGHVLLDRDRPRLRDAIAALEATGLAEKDLLVAWDFTVNDDAATIHDALAARDVALAAMGQGGSNITYTITSDTGTVNGDPRIARRIELDFQAPAVTGPALAGFYRDPTGSVIATGMMTAHAFIEVPPCATSANGKSGVLIYGHGFFGSLQEARDAEYLRDIMSSDGCLIVAATLWTGMSQDDIPNALIALNDLNQGWGFGERIFQGIINNITLEQLVRGKLADEVLIDTGGSLVDVPHTFFLGISMGHILGSVFMAYDPAIQHGVLHVGAANWSLLFERSDKWSVYGVPLKGSYDTLLDADIMEQVLEIEMEPADGASVAGLAIPGTPDKSLLMMTSLHDAQVPNLAGFYQARSLGLTLLQPSSVVTPYGFDGKTPDLTRAYVIVDEHPDPEPPPDNAVISFDNNAHENPRRRAGLQEMMKLFWSYGEAMQTCTGACDCAAGNCGVLQMPMYGGE
ncbi:MAG: hypothetical protein ABJE66_33390 [Deltaproteobacteria bacterium]